jgi:Fe-S-cluster containining protein
MEVLEEIVEKIREKLSEFCIASCKARCCNTGNIILRSPEEMVDFGAVGSFDIGYFTVDVSKGCPKLSGNLCSAYLKRPKICRDFPLFLRGKTLFVAEWCDGVAAAYIKDDIEKISKEGIKVFMQ